MLDINDIKKIELEITSDCNAACPGCARTLNSDLLRINSFSLQDLQRIFPTTNHIADKEFKFCGVLGDPAIHPQFADMLEYLLQHGAKANINIKAEGTNEHHKIEAIFKAFAKAIKVAVKRDPDKMILPSTKGSL